MATNSTPVKLDAALVSLESPAELAKFANTLKGFIVANKLFTPIQGKNYVNVEGWQFAGAALGVFPIVRSTECVATGTEEIKYQARVELVRLSDGLVVGAAEAVCSNLESKRKSADEYVIQSMAQTRATGKAFRTFLAWIMKLAGYETTPSEEAVDPNETPAVTKNDMPIEDVKTLVKQRLDAMKASEKVALLKNRAGVMHEDRLTDQQYRGLYDVLSQEAA